MKRPTFRFIAGLLVAFLTGGPALARLSSTDLLVAARAIGFIENLRAGPITVGIVYLPGSAESAQQAHEIASLMDTGLRVGDLVLKPTLIPLSQAKAAKVSLFFLTQGVGTQATQLARVSQARKIACVTFDIAQVRNGDCTMGIRTQPRIEILVNRNAAEASGTDFAAVFRIMITEI